MVTQRELDEAQRKFEDGQISADTDPKILNKAMINEAQKHARKVSEMLSAYLRNKASETEFFNSCGFKSDKLSDPAFVIDEDDARWSGSVDVDKLAESEHQIYYHILKMTLSTLFKDVLEWMVQKDLARFVEDFDGKGLDTVYYPLDHTTFDEPLALYRVGVNYDGVKEHHHGHLYLDEFDVTIRKEGRDLHCSLESDVQYKPDPNHHPEIYLIPTESSPLHHT